MAIRARENFVGAWAFLIGVVLAFIGGIVINFGFGLNPFIFALLAILGLVMGFFINVTDNNGTRFLTCAVSLVIVSFAGISSTTSLSTVEFARVSIIGIAVGKIISSTLSALLILLIPATIVVAIKSLFSVAQR